MQFENDGICDTETATASHKLPSLLRFDAYICRQLDSHTS